MTGFRFCKTILLPSYHMAFGSKRHTIEQLEVLQVPTVVWYGVRKKCYCSTSNRRTTRHMSVGFGLF
jgi:hypothetical protein